MCEINDFSLSLDKQRDFADLSANSINFKQTIIKCKYFS